MQVHDTFKKKASDSQRPFRPERLRLPEVSLHNKTPWNSECTPDTRTIGVMFAGRNAANTEDDIIYIGVNAYWEKQEIQLPNLPLGRKWRVIMNTEFEHSETADYQAMTRWTGIDRMLLCPRSVVIAQVEKF